MKPPKNIAHEKHKQNYIFRAFGVFRGQNDFSRLNYYG